MRSKSKVIAKWLTEEALPSIFTWVIWFGVLYGLRQNFSQAVLFSISMGIVMCAAMYSAILFEWKERGKPPLDAKGLFMLFFAIPLASLIVGLGLYGTGVGTIDLFEWSLKTEKWKPLGIAMTTAYTLGAGGFLFAFRYSTRALYGLTEVAAGVAVAVHRVISPSKIDLNDLGLHLALLTAGIYLVVRGFDNIHQGLTKDPIDPVAAYLLKKFRPNGDAANQSPS